MKLKEFLKLKKNKILESQEIQEIQEIKKMIERYLSDLRNPTKSQQNPRNPQAYVPSSECSSPRILDTRYRTGWETGCRVPSMFHFGFMQ